VSKKRKNRGDIHGRLTCTEKAAELLGQDEVEKLARACRHRFYGGPHDGGRGSWDLLRVRPSQTLVPTDDSPKVLVITAKETERQVRQDVMLEEEIDDQTPEYAAWLKAALQQAEKVSGLLDVVNSPVPKWTRWPK
jgi:hypothetical protein